MHCRIRVERGEWVPLDDPLDSCRHDFIKPICVKGRNLGQPEWGKLETLVNGERVEYTE